MPNNGIDGHTDQPDFQAPQRPSVALIGECMIELAGAGDERLKAGFGGDVLNSAIYLKRLVGECASVRFASILGDDPFADRMLQAWQDEGLECDAVGRMAGRTTGLYLIQTDENKDRSFHYWRGEAPARQMMKPEWSWVMERAFACDWIYFSGITLGILNDDDRALFLEQVGTAAARGAMVAFDGNFRPRLWPNIERAAEWYRRAWQSCSIALAGYDDEKAVFGDHDPMATMARLSSLCTGEIVLKRAAAPVLLRTSGEEWHIDTRVPRAVADTTAAGDSFNGGYLAARILGCSPKDAAAIACALAAEVIGHRGAIVPDTAMTEVRAMLAGALERTGA